MADAHTNTVQQPQAMTGLLSLHGKTALVTGATRGLGLAIARVLAAAGAQVLINGRDEDRVAKAVARIEAGGLSARPLVCDIADSSAIGRAIEALEHLDILVNNVGIRDRRAVDAFTLDDFRRLLDVNLLAPFDLCRRAAARMPAGGRILNLTSIAGPLAAPGDAIYTIAKGALEVLTRTMAVELGPRAITVNAIAPGFFATEANAETAADPAVARWLKTRTALGRWGQEDEIFGAALLLCAPAASYITGQVLAVDGGFMVRM